MPDRTVLTGPRNFPIAPPSERRGSPLLSLSCHPQPPEPLPRHQSALQPPPRIDTLRHLFAARLQSRRAPDGWQEAGCTVSGPASGLYLYLWNRADAGQAGVTVTGDPGLLSAWQSSVRVRWG